MQHNTGFSLRAALAVCGLGLMLAGCADAQPQSSVSRDLNSGVTSSNGGGMQPANFGGVVTRNPQ